MPEKNLTEQVLETIKEKNIKPKPRWEFLLKNYSIWVITSLFLLISSLSASVIIYMVRNNDWDLRPQLSGSIVSFVILTLPHLWLIFLVLFIAVVYYNFKHTKRGYKYKFHIIIISTCVASILLGFLFHELGLAQVIDNALSEKVPAYKNFIMCRRARIWSRPEKGFLSGAVQKVDTQKKFTIEDCHNKIWEIYLLGNMPPPKFQLKPRLKVKLIGVKMTERVFMTTHIRPFAPNPGHWPIFRKSMPAHHFNPHQ